MGFKKFKHLDDVLNQYQLSAKRAIFLAAAPPMNMPENLKSELDYVLNNIPYRASEAAIRENIIYPILKEAFKKYDDILMLWANKSISYDKELGGIPDYIIAKQSHLGKIVFGIPLLAVVEAKKDDFEGGWAQCLLEMYAIQKINARTDVPVFGIVSNGDYWEFGQLLASQFTHNGKVYILSQPDMLYSVISFFFGLCKQNALKIS